MRKHLDALKNSAANSGDRVVLTVPEAGRMLGLGRNAAYEAAARGEIPTIRIGKKLLRVPKIAFDRMLEQGAGVKQRELPTKGDL